MFFQVMIVPAPSGFGEYQCLPINGDGWVDEQDLLDEITSNGDYDVYELTDEIVESVLPGQVEDIRGRIHGQPERVFAIVDGESVSYFGITAR